MSQPSTLFCHFLVVSVFRSASFFFGVTWVSGLRVPRGQMLGFIEIAVGSAEFCSVTFVFHVVCTSEPGSVHVNVRVGVCLACFSPVQVG